MKPNLTTYECKAVAINTKQNGQRGFTLMETAIALVVMMVVGLGAASLFFYAVGANSKARDRELAMAVAQQQIEILRNAKFENLDATVAAFGGANKTVTSADLPYTVVTTIANSVAGDATKKTITVQVTPKGATGVAAITQVFGGVTLVTQRSTKELGPNRGA
jgi:type II secretory pathway pseudopilin PulG